MTARCKTILRKGAKVRISADIGCIPAGIYRFEGENELFLNLSVRGKAFVGIDRRWRHLCEPVKSAKLKSLSTTYEDFVSRYYALLEQQRHGFDPEKPLTMCVLSQNHRQEPSIH